MSNQPTESELRSAIHRIRVLIPGAMILNKLHPSFQDEIEHTIHCLNSLVAKANEADWKDIQGKFK